MQQLVKLFSIGTMLLLCSFGALGQHNNINVPLFYEKVYLHTDRDTYASGEDIWFKAYVVNAQNNQPIDFSHNLYVELISPALNITQRKVIRVDCGLGNGDFKLPDTLSAGNYRIRAYTNWMRNFGDSFVFEKNISIVNTLGNQPGIIAKAKPSRKPKKKDLPVLKQDTVAGPSIQFFPEGGSMVNDVRSVVAVKAEDVNGKGIAVMGDIIATSGRAVAKFSTDTLGMGSFTLMPDESQVYHTDVSINGVKQTYSLPNALHKGFVLSVSSVPGSIAAEISCNGFALSDYSGSYVILEARHGGKTYFKQQVPVGSSAMLVQIPDEKFPEGVACITLYDEHAKPLNERLIYVHHDDNPVITLTPDKMVYQPKEKVTVKIKLSDTTRTNLSFAAVDAGIVPVQPENILSYLTLKSEIKGSIEHPERYFDNANSNRFKQLDLLLLTQGWRDFVWKKIANEPLKITYDVETGLPITGHIRRMWANKPMPQMNITMFAPKATKDKMFTAVSDTSGKFTIDGAILYGYQFVNFTSRDSRGKADTKKNGWIRVDSLFQDRMTVSPPMPMLDSVNKTDSLLEREKNRKKFSFNGDNLLKTVQIKGYSNVLPPEIHPITLSEQKLYGSVCQYLMYMIPGAHWEPGNCGPLLLVDYFPARYVGVTAEYTDHSKIDYLDPCFRSECFALPMDCALKITINRRQTIYGINYSVHLILRPGVLGVHDFFDNTMADFVGYYQAREFYKPKYEEASDKPDYRTTIHWEPNITTDRNGEATVSFYNADPKSKIRLVVEGLTDKGLPVAATASYSVK